MTISNKKLVDLLVQKTDLNEKQVEENLHQFISHVQEEVENNGVSKIVGLGQLSLEEGTLCFTAEDHLATEINYKYAGMKPIELIGAFKDTSEVPYEKEQEAGSAESVIGIEEYRDESTEKQEPEEQVFPDEEPEAEPKEKQPDERPLEEVASTFELDEETVSEEEQQKEEEEAEAAVPAGTSSFESTKKKQREDPIGKLLIAAVIVIAIGVSGWLVYDMGLLGSHDRSEGNISENQPAESANIAPGEAGRQENENEANDSVSNDVSQSENSSEQNDLKPISNTTSIAEESRQSIYGLRGGAAPKVNDGYTIVVHSLRNEAKVRRINEELQQEGYRTIIYSANVMDTTFWRLGLGQFKTIKDATEAALTLPDPYKGNHFVKRIQ